jgi:hypothetical protein
VDRKSYAFPVSVGNRCQPVSGRATPRRLGDGATSVSRLDRRHGRGRARTVRDVLNPPARPRDRTGRVRVVRSRPRHGRGPAAPRARVRRGPPRPTAAKC